jgi:hypothetical protein
MRIIYSQIENSKDIGKINRGIRNEIRQSKRKSRIAELERRSRYLIALIYSPSFRKKLNVEALRKRAKAEYKLTSKVANVRIQSLRKSRKGKKR